VVIANEEPGKTITARLDIPDEGSLQCASPEQPEAQPTTGTLRIPARSAIVVMEQ
jgi:hypothetical protein